MKTKIEVLTPNKVETTSAQVKTMNTSKLKAAIYELIALENIELAEIHLTSEWMKKYNYHVV